MSEVASKRKQLVRFGDESALDAAVSKAGAVNPGKAHDEESADLERLLNANDLSKLHHKARWARLEEIGKKRVFDLLHVSLSPELKKRLLAPRGERGGGVHRGDRTLSARARLVSLLDWRKVLPPENAKLVQSRPPTTEEYAWLAIALGLRRGTGWKTVEEAFTLECDAMEKMRDRHGQRPAEWLMRERPSAPRDVSAKTLRHGPAMALPDKKSPFWA